jgi:hypothetical protein
MEKDKNKILVVADGSSESDYYAIETILNNIPKSGMDYNTWQFT